jgi:hypothetical protein
MSFKRIKTKGLNEVVLAAYISEHGKGMWPYCIISIYLIWF